MSAAPLDELKGQVVPIRETSRPWIRPIYVRPATRSDAGAWFWQCRPCMAKAPTSSGCGHADTLGDAIDQARAHQLADCPTYATATRRLLEAVLLVPDYTRAIAGVDAWTCSRCPEWRVIDDRDAHTSEHLAGTVFA